MFLSLSSLFAGQVPLHLVVKPWSTPPSAAAPGYLSLAHSPNQIPSLTQPCQAPTLEPNIWGCGVISHCKLQLQRKTPADRDRQFLDYVGAEPGVGNTQCKHYADKESSEYNRRRNGDVGQLTQQILYACTYNSQKSVCPYMRVYVYICIPTSTYIWLEIVVYDLTRIFIFLIAICSGV